MDARRQFAGTKIRPDTQASSVQASFQAMNVALLTGQKRVKLLNDFSHLFLMDVRRDRVLEVFKARHRLQWPASADPAKRPSRTSCTGLRPRLTRATRFRAVLATHSTPSS